MTLILENNADELFCRMPLNLELYHGFSLLDEAQHLWQEYCRNDVFLLIT